MNEETADSGEINMEAAMDSISNDLFPKEEGPVSEAEGTPVEESTEETPVETAEEQPEEKTEEKPEEQSEETELRAAPQSWKKEMHEFWNGLDPAVQNYIEQREEQMREGLEKDRTDANMGRTMRDVIAPYSDYLRNQGVNENDMIRDLLQTHFQLSTADEATRTNMIRQIAQSFNVSLDGGEAPQVDPNIKAMQDRINNLEYTIRTGQQRSEQENRSRIESELEQFASSHEFFDEVSEQIVPLINAGYELEDAYSQALWLNPVTRQKQIDQASKEAAEKAAEQAKQEADKASKARLANVRGRDTSRTPTEPKGTIDDTLRETYREIQSRSH